MGGYRFRENKSASLAALFLVAVAGSGCDSTPIRVDVGVAGISGDASSDAVAALDAGPSDGIGAGDSVSPSPDAADGAADIDAGVDRAAPGDSSVPDAAPAPDMLAATDAPRPFDDGARSLLKRVVPGRARMVGTHLTGCSNQGQDATAGDRWCAFSMPSPMLGMTELWVLDITKAATNGVVCDGTDTNCRRLTTNLWTGVPTSGPAFPSADRFDGDTLIFHADGGTSNGDYYVGPIYAWRPGWTAAKQISSGTKAYGCTAHASAEVFLCYENLGFADPFQFDLTAGRLPQPAQFMKRITPSRPGSGFNPAAQWRAAFSADGSTLAFSTGGTTLTDKETLFAVRFDNLSAITMVTATPGISQWSLSGDDKRVYFLRDYNYSTTGDPSGALAMADFPTGANEVMLQTGVGAPQALSVSGQDRGVAFFQDVKAGLGTYKILPDPTKSTAVVTVVQSLAGVLSLSPDLKWVTYFKTSDDTTGLTDLYVARTDGSGATCALDQSTTTTRFGEAFSPSGTLTFWEDQTDPALGTGQSWIANPDGCGSKRKIADAMDFRFFAGDSGLIFSEVTNPDAVTVRGTKLGPGAQGPVGDPQIIQTGVGSFYAIVGSERNYVLASPVRAATAADGLYLYGPIAF